MLQIFSIREQQKSIPSFCIRVLNWPFVAGDSVSSLCSLSVQSGGECHLTKSSKIQPGFAAYCNTKKVLGKPRNKEEKTIRCIMEA